jgi:broad specificity phosphatase PhoE
MKLYLIRHAAVTVREDVPSAQWHLSPEGRRAAETLAGEPYWKDLHGMYSSAEPKAIATAQRVAAAHGVPLFIEPDLGEVDRPWAGWGGYRELVRRYLGGEALDGWEPREAALVRARRSIAGVVERSRGHDAAIASHGMLLTLYLSDLLGLDGAATHEQWTEIAFPDVAIVEPEARRLARGWTGAG